MLLNSENENSNISIQIINPQQTIKVRHIVLRNGKNIETCYFSGDDLPTTFHVGIFVEDQLVGITSIYKTLNDLFEQNLEQYQMRGMAILPEFQKKGFGEKLIQFSEKKISESCKQNCILWFNARESAIHFYKKQGFSEINSMFEIPEIGNHVVMYKLLSNR